MAKILKIDGENISVGMDDGSIKEFKKSDCNFKPLINDEVEIFRDNEKVIINKKQTMLENLTNKKLINKVIYCVFALFFGGIGIHKFYAGKNVAGILYLIFCWTFVPSILAFIDFIIGLFKSSDANGNIII